MTVLLLNTGYRSLYDNVGLFHCPTGNYYCNYINVLYLIFIITIIIDFYNFI